MHKRTLVLKYGRISGDGIMDEQRYNLLMSIWQEQDRAYDLMCEYDSIPHHYGEYVLFQTEGYIVNLIAAYPDITVTELGLRLNKTTSACSQVVRKLRNKGYVEQRRNPENNRIYNLTLTEKGRLLYDEHQKFNLSCRQKTFDRLRHCSDEELRNHIKVQKKLNEAYRDDIRRSREQNQIAGDRNKRNV